jgi:cytochrome b561
LASKNFERYTSLAVILHWLIALLLVWGFTLGWVMEGIPKTSPDKMLYVSWHKWIGVTVGFLVIVRIAWRITHQPPALPHTVPDWQRYASHSVHALLYFLMLAIPLTGYFYSSAAGRPVVYLGLIPLPPIIAPNPDLKSLLKTLHVTFNYTLLGVLGLHIAAALKHHFIDRDQVLARMLPFLKKR